MRRSCGVYVGLLSRPHLDCADAIVCIERTASAVLLRRETCSPVCFCGRPDAGMLLSFTVLHWHFFFIGTHPLIWFGSFSPSLRADAQDDVATDTTACRFLTEWDRVLLMFWTLCSFVFQPFPTLTSCLAVELCFSEVVHCRWSDTPAFFFFSLARVVFARFWVVRTSVFFSIYLCAYSTCCMSVVVFVL